MKSLLKTPVAIGLIASVIGLSAAVAASVSDNFADHCSKCHGADGKGQTKMGKKLNVRDMTTDAFKKEFDAAKALTQLKDGLKKDGKEIKKSFASDLSEAEMKALIGYVKELK